MKRSKSQRGFTLIESLVALAIAAIVLNGFYAALSTGGLLERRAETQAGRMLVAATVLDRVGVDIPLRPGTRLNDRLDGHDWDLVIGTIPAVDMQLGPVRDGELLFVSVSVAVPGGPPVTLRAIRYAEAPI
ncbi:PulJ/GspJ family protein [Jannaschia aquimarina]|uniref:Uncharacterized protein n=1 Tax=Jannaschia aquimarina TaxID=935700 RepID=A0A0D1D7D4_9RHOB|nr:prepilin-type N-terminal cleavage/methylation domain-containing protein [Jannaschia aquimarina]KIT15863.1 hypothetical protein jaqu_24430 [Jannaschia aquimarina]SNT10300.1 prepilin-type N-terminal cleavage/methylation domain-containing protein [Jannaschia aquimarina]